MYYANPKSKPSAHLPVVRWIDRLLDEALLPRRCVGKGTEDDQGERQDKAWAGKQTTACKAGQKVPQVDDSHVEANESTTV
jgi:hypothetical protein